MGEATVCVEDWESGEQFTCTVTHTDLPSPLKKTVSRPKGRGPRPLCPGTLQALGVSPQWPPA